MKRIAILISGRGSNLAHIVRACAEQGWPAQVVAVVADRPQAAGLVLAAAQGIATAVVDRAVHADRETYDAALERALQPFAPDLLVLAGFMRVLGAPFVQRHAGRLLNIHPSLLPAFPGLHTHRRVLAAGCKLSGATVHYVTPELDHGPIVLQGVVPVLATDTEATLAARVLATEHAIYPMALRWAVEDKLVLHDGVVRHREGASQVWM